MVVGMKLYRLVGIGVHKVERILNKTVEFKYIEYDESSESAKEGKRGEKRRE